MSDYRSNEDPKIERYRRDNICDAVFRIMQLVIFSCVVIIDRASIGRVGHEIDDWVTYNLVILAFEIMFRYLASHGVSHQNFEQI